MKKTAVTQSTKINLGFNPAKTATLPSVELAKSVKNLESLTAKNIIDHVNSLTGGDHFANASLKNKASIIKKAQVILANFKVADVAESKKRTAQNKNRNFERQSLNGIKYSKGRLVHAIVADYVEKHPKITVAQLKKVFPDTLVPVYGVFTDFDTAVAKSAKKQRYYTKDTDVINIKGFRICVTNQFSTENIKPTLAVAVELGNIIK